MFYNFTNNLWQVSGGYSQVGENFNPEVGFLPRRGYRRPEFRAFFQPQPKKMAVDPALRAARQLQRLLGLRTASCRPRTGTIHSVRDPADARRALRLASSKYRRTSRSPPFVVFNRDGNRVVIPPGFYTGGSTHCNEFQNDPSARVTGTVRYRIGNYYDGDFKVVRDDAGDYRSRRAVQTASVGWTRQDIDLPYGQFVTDLVPVKASYSFTTLASLRRWCSTTARPAQFSSNIRLALLNRSGTGLFVVYNDRRDTTEFNPIETLGRSFVVKYTRLFDF